MNSFLAILLGVILGLFLGGFAGLGAGLLWIEIFNPSNFEGAAGFAVAFLFIPLGAIIGAIVTGILIGVLADRAARRQRQASEPPRAE